MRDRLYIEKRINDKVIPELDKTEMFGVNVGAVSRTELFLFAMSLGIKKGYRTPLKSSHGFILEAYLKSFDGATSQIYSVLVNEMIQAREEDKISDKDIAYQIAEEYANTGFIELEKWVTPNTDWEKIMYTLLDELNEKYASLDLK